VFSHYVWQCLLNCATRGNAFWCLGCGCCVSNAPTHRPCADPLDLIANFQDEEEEEVSNHLNELRRQGMIESLIGMGFPVEWALRAAEHCDVSASEDAAITWIIERMEMGQTKMDELEADSRLVL
jgi:hypothetical protein